MIRLQFLPRRFWRSRRGQSLVEFGLTAPVVLLVSMGIVDFGRAFFMYANASNSLRNALRYGAIPGYTGSSIPQYADCQGMIDIAKDLIFTDNTPVITVSYIDQHNASNILFSCADSNPGNPSVSEIQMGTENGDIIRISFAGQVHLITPLFPQTLYVSLEGERTLVKYITIQDPPYCGNDLCDESIGETADNCGCDCDGVCFDGVVPTITFVKPEAGVTVSEYQWIEITASDTETSSTLLKITFTVNDGTSDTVICDPNPATAAPPPVEVGTTSTFRCRWDTTSLTNGTYRIKITAVDTHGNSITTNTEDHPALVLNTFNLATCGNGTIDPDETTTRCFRDTGGLSTFTVSGTTECEVNNQFRHVDFAWSSVTDAFKYRIYAQCEDSINCTPTFGWTPVFESAGTSCSGRDGNYRPFCYSLSGNATYVLWGTNTAQNFYKLIDYYIVALNANDVAGPPLHLQGISGNTGFQGTFWPDSSPGINSHLCNQSDVPGILP